MKLAMMVMNGRLRGATTFGWSSSSVKPDPRLASVKPYGGIVTPEPKPEKRLLTNETMFPQRSAVAK
jgi:hypothetical protein